MRTPNPVHQLSVEEGREVSAVLGNQVLLNGLRKIWLAEAEYWQAQLKAEALKPNGNTNLMVQFAARQSMAEGAERLIRKGVGA